jgi:hypothetical protein
MLQGGLHVTWLPALIPGWGCVHRNAVSCRAPHTNRPSDIRTAHTDSQMFRHCKIIKQDFEISYSFSYQVTINVFTLSFQFYKL